MQVNELFRDVVVEVCKPKEGDVLWVHDYHLMLLPSLVSPLSPHLQLSLRCRCRSCRSPASVKFLSCLVQVAAEEMRAFQKRIVNIVFFLHIPFPTSQIFRALHCGEQLLHVGPAFPNSQSLVNRAEV